MARSTALALAALAALLVAVGGLVAFTGTSTAPQPGPLRVVAAENFYGSIAAQIGGRRVQVTSVLSDPNADPHLFEPGTQNGLAVAEAAVVIQNGVGYDSFMSRLEAAAPSSHRTVVTMADVLGVHGVGANPHLWYDVPRLGRMAGAIATALTRADPAGAAAYRAGLARFLHRLLPLRSELRRIRDRDAGLPVAYTEPVPGYLLAAAGLRNRTPTAFSRAIEDGSEPSPQALAAMNALLQGRHVRVLLENRQTTSPITQQVVDLARRSGIPVVAVTETMPAGQSYQSWQLAQARLLARALGR
ncbi:MAG TPA: zinc ABC transporter substrate-binding protein [Gaiellales bacterium]|nr:zinc ABC transporter substrate-binding protein [Gaiellales bacterium]